MKLVVCLQLYKMESSNIKNMEQVNNYTPIKCSKTKVALNLGDYVQNERGQCGHLAWDDCFNRYLIRSATGGNVYASTYTKIEELHENTYNSIRTECRRNHLKKKW
jgi:hypothetical protein